MLCDVSCTFSLLFSTKSVFPYRYLLETYLNNTARLIPSPFALMYVSYTKINLYSPQTARSVLIVYNIDDPG